jgi:hypothetical protein
MSAACVGSIFKEHLDEEKGKLTLVYLKTVLFYLFSFVI